MTPRACTCFIAMSLATAAFCAPAQAETINAAPGADGVAADGVCSIREAVQVANTDTDTADCHFGLNADTIVLAPGTYNLTGTAGENGNGSGDLDIASDITFNGAGAGVTIIDAGGNDRVFDIQSGKTVSINNLTITGGHAPAGASGSSPTAGENGGGIRNAGSVTLSGVTVSHNTAGAGGDGTGSSNGAGGGQGGGIFSGSGTTLAIVNSLIDQNTAGKGGDGADNNGGTGANGATGGAGGGVAAFTATFTDTTISGNDAGVGGTGGDGVSPGTGGRGGDGGAVSGGKTFTRVTVTGNDAGDGAPAGTDTDSGNAAGSGFGGRGGGIQTSGSGVAITDSVITGNHAGDGGNGALGTGMFFASTGQGGDGGAAGGLFLVLTGGAITGTTVADNTAGAGGSSQDGTPGAGGFAGGMWLVESTPGTPVISNSAITGNSAGAGGSSLGDDGGAGGAGGGAVLGTSLTANFTNVTFTGNTTGTGGSAGFLTGGAGGDGGAIVVVPTAAATLVHVTIASNQAAAGGSATTSGAPGSGAGIFTQGPTSLTNSIVASNTPDNCDASPAIVDAGHNILFGAAGCSIAAGGDPLLGQLADNGGLTKTMALGDGSSAIDIVPSSGADCAATDQRGIARPQFAACDAGAFELAPPPPPPASNDQSGPGTGPSTPTENTPTGATPDKTPPGVKLLLTKQKLLKALKKGYFAFFSDNELGDAAADLFASGKTAKGTAAKRKRVAHGTLKVTKTGKQKLVLRFTKKAKKAFKKRKKVTLTLVLTVKDAAGNATTKTKTLTLKR